MNICYSIRYKEKIRRLYYAILKGIKLWSASQSPSIRAERKRQSF